MYHSRVPLIWIHLDKHEKFQRQVCCNKLGIQKVYKNNVDSDKLDGMIYELDRLRVEASD